MLAFHVLLSTHTFTSLSPSTPTHHSDSAPACRFPVPPVHCGLLSWLCPAVLAEQCGYAPRSRLGRLGRRSSLVNDRILLTATGLSDRAIASAETPSLSQVAVSLLFHTPAYDMSMQRFYCTRAAACAVCRPSATLSRCTPSVMLPRHYRTRRCAVVI